MAANEHGTFEPLQTRKRAGFMALFRIAIRWTITGRKTSHRSSFLFSVIGIAAGIVALIVVMSVMNGFQRQYIDSLLETSSFHVRIMPESSDPSILAQSLRENSLVRSVTPFIETNLLAEGAEGRQNVVRAMWISPQDLGADKGFCNALHISESAAEDGIRQGIMIGTETARLLGMYNGQNLVLRGAVVNPDEGVQQYEIVLPVGGLFRSGYYEIDAGLVILPMASASKLKTLPASLVLGIKLKNPEKVDQFIASLAHTPGIGRTESWRDYNRSFFSALRTEKVVMFILVSIIFAVVAINIHYAMRRNIARKSRELAILAAIGTDRRSIGSIFMLEGLMAGILGALGGIGIGIPLAKNIDHVINFAVGIAEAVVSFLYRLGIAKSVPDLSLFSPTIFYIESIPSRVYASDIGFIAFFAILFPALAVYAAYRRFRNASPLEVLRSE